MTDITSPNFPLTFSGQFQFRIYEAFKRLMDLMAAALGLILLAPFLAALAWIIRRDSPGPAFYRSPRLGRGGRPFQMLKFRTMHERPESYAGPRVTAQDDPRVTSLGRWLRDTKLNELPQLWNVLKGEMSLVGPRPEDPEIAADWHADVRQEVLSVRPGITSPASVVYRDEENLLHNGSVMKSYLDEILPSKLRLDQLYVRHRSLWGDLDVLIWTLLALAPRIERAAPPEVDLFVGPVYRLMRRYVSWFSIDMLVTFAAIGLAGLIWRSFGPLDVGWQRAIGLAFGFALLFSLTSAALGANRVSWSKATAEDALDLLPATAFATLIALLLNNLVHTLNPDGSQAILWTTKPLFPIGLILFAAILAFTGFVGVRYRQRLFTGMARRWMTWRGQTAAARDRVLIVGSGQTGQFAIWMLSNNRYSATLQVVGLVDDDLFKQGARIRGLQVLGQCGDIPTLVRRLDVGLIIFAIHNISATERRRLLNICQNSGARIVVFPDIQAAMEKALRNGDHSHEPLEESLPCWFCLEQNEPADVHDRFERLECLASKGDLAGVQAEVRSLREAIHG
ncbi:MAG: sugar transferase [Anaerolineales bacterium]|jgi:lipopolysaccharide/colanic/teichoic acid biosynthesis glycosyltransferase|nr:sugar transferase [Anaerolineales bacterium]